MTEETLTTLMRLLAALAAGSLIGLERSYNGRPAGFRTHALVCMASSVLMLLTVYQWELLKEAPLDTIRVDPTRMAQGIMTGIGFLGAGVIMKERYTIRGLTTAASIWITASIGVLIGMGFYLGGLMATLLAIGTLSLFRVLEAWLPSLEYARLSIATPRKEPISEEQVIAVLKDHDISPSSHSYALRDEGKQIYYEMIICSRKQANFRQLARSLDCLEAVVEYSVSPRST